jgi:hypothetical protein
MSEKQRYSVTALSKKLKLDRGTIRERLDEAGYVPIQKSNGKETLYELSSEELKNLGNDEYDLERIRKIKAEADLKELDLATKRGEFGSVREFTEVTQKLFKSLHKKLGVDLAKKIARKLHNANSETEVAEILQDAINYEFKSIRADFTKYL